MKCKLELKKEVENFNWVNLETNLNDDSLKLLENYLLEDPKAGAVIEGTGGARKYVLLLMITEEKAVEALQKFISSEMEYVKRDGWVIEMEDSTSFIAYEQGYYATNHSRRIYSQISKSRHERCTVYGRTLPLATATCSGCTA